MGTILKPLGLWKEEIRACGRPRLLLARVVVLYQTESSTRWSTVVGKGSEFQRGPVATNDSVCSQRPALCSSINRFGEMQELRSDFGEVEEGTLQTDQQELSKRQ